MTSNFTNSWWWTCKCKMRPTVSYVKAQFTRESVIITFDFSWWASHYSLLVPHVVIISCFMPTTTQFYDFSIDMAHVSAELKKSACDECEEITLPHVSCCWEDWHWRQHKKERARVALTNGKTHHIPCSQAVPVTTRRFLEILKLETIIYNFWFAGNKISSSSVGYCCADDVKSTKFCASDQHSRVYFIILMLLCSIRLDLDYVFPWIKFCIFDINFVLKLKIWRTLNCMTTCWI